MKMATLPAVCDHCNLEIKDIFDPSSGSRQDETIAGDLYVTDCCFVRDEIRFINSGRLIFCPGETEKEQQYCKEYFVICRKLIVKGGHKPFTLNPCGPDDPGGMYTANNVITWLDRLKEAQGGSPPNPAQAGDGQDFDRNHWQNLGQGNNGKEGGNGSNGNKGAGGHGGIDAPSFTLVALEVEIGALDHLTIDFDGQNGGQGGLGQKGGNGGNGMGGREGESDTSWPGKGCDRQPGHGGPGGRGGDGGPGGDGGNGGEAGNIAIISTNENISSGPFVSGNISYVNDGGSGGDGGKGGFGSRGGFGGNPGWKTSECDNASTGPDGDAGWPPVGLGAGSDANKGATGAHGAAGGLSFEEVKHETCADLLPLPIEVLTSLTPSGFCRGYSTPDTGEGSLTGKNLAQVTTVDVTGLSNVTATVKLTSTDTQLDLKFDIAGNSGLGAGNLVLKPAFGASKQLNNAIEVRRFEVLSITPTTGARGADVDVQITGNCFDPGALSQDVIVSGLGVNVFNVLVLDAQTIQCVFSVGNLAALGARDVTVKTGLKQHTLLNAFTVTT
jgi:hypothetical protein